jgi:hypothetical protein
MPGGDGARKAGDGKKGKCESGERQRTKLARQGTLFGTGHPAAQANRLECHPTVLLREGCQEEVRGDKLRHSTETTTL